MNDRRYIRRLTLALELAELHGSEADARVLREQIAEALRGDAPTAG